MLATTYTTWLLVICACALTGWWLSLRPNASYRGAGSTVTVLIFTMAALMAILALAAPRPHVPVSAYAMGGNPTQNAPTPNTVNP